MATDLNQKQVSGQTKVVGADTNGSETNYAAVTTAADLQTADVPNQVGLETTLSLTTTAQELKVGGSALVNRKFVCAQATTNNVKWGYTSACLFDLFKNQYMELPAGSTCKVYMKVSTGTGTAVVAEK